MRVLALDTTTPDGSVAIVDDHCVVLERRGDSSRPHAERLPGDVVKALESAGISSSDIDLYAVVAGPGSFTGLRIGIAAIQGFAMVHGRQLVAVSALDALGDAGGDGQSAGALVAAWMDAHRREVFSCLYRVTDAIGRSPARLSIVDGPHVGPPAETLTRWQRDGHRPSVIAGDGAVLYADVIGEAAIVRPSPSLATIAAQMAIERARLGLTIAPAAVQPIYVRRPDAEVARDARRLTEPTTTSSS